MKNCYKLTVNKKNLVSVTALSNHVLIDLNAYFLQRIRYTKYMHIGCRQQLSNNYLWYINSLYTEIETNIYQVTHVNGKLVTVLQYIQFGFTHIVILLHFYGMVQIMNSNFETAEMVFLEAAINIIYMQFSM